MYNYSNPRRPKRGVMRLGNCFGVCVLGFLIIQQFCLAMLDLTGLYSLYKSSLTFQTAINIPITLLSIGLPFWAALRIIDSRDGYKTNICLNKPKSTKSASLLVGIGLLVCMFGNFAASSLVISLERFNITLSSPEFTIPDELFGKILFVIYAAVLPALIEEYAIRGVVMQSLRRYGDWYAIILSALIFALMHGNWVQAPFAFIAGLGMGYAVILSGSLWTGVLIHFINNMFSVTLSLIQASAANESAYRIAATIGSAVILLIGLICLAVFVFSHEKLDIYKLYQRVNFGSDVYFFIFSPFMIVALGIMTYMTKFYIQAPSGILYHDILPFFFLLLWTFALAISIWNNYRSGKSKR